MLCLKRHVSHMGYQIKTGGAMEEHILEVAKRLFVQQGYQQTEMQDIARAANVGRSTLYRYFPTKEQLAAQVAIIVLREVGSAGAVGGEAAGKTGWETLRQSLLNYAHRMSQRTDALRFISEFDTIFGGVYHNKENEEAFLQSLNATKAGEDLFEKALTLGVQDGSVRPDIDVILTAQAISNALMAVAQRTLGRRHRMLEALGYREEILLQTIELMMEGIRNR